MLGNTQAHTHTWRNTHTHADTFLRLHQLFTLGLNTNEILKKKFVGIKTAMYVSLKLCRSQLCSL